MNSLAMPQWLPPLVCLVILLGLYPQVRQWDRERKVEVAQEDMGSDLEVENRTDGTANEVKLLELKINELLSTTSGRISLNRSGIVHYVQTEDGDTYEADFFITAIDYFVFEESVKGECVREPCVTVTEKGVFSDETVQMDVVYILLQSGEQGDKLVQLLQQYEQITAGDTKIDTGMKRKFKRLLDGVMYIGVIFAVA